MSRTEKEQKLLGCLMLDLDALAKVEHLVDETTFEDERHQRIYQAIVDCKGIKDEGVTHYQKRFQVIDALGDELSEAGGAQYIDKLTHDIMYTDGVVEQVNKLNNA